MEYVVYILTLSSSGHFYVGSAQDIEKRFKRHIYELRQGTHHNATLQALWSEPTEINLCVIHGGFSSRDKAYREENRLKHQFLSSPLARLCCNINLGETGGDSLSAHPQRQAIVEMRADLIRRRMRSFTPEQRVEKFGLPGARNGMYGKTHTAATREMFSRLHRGNKYRLGSKLSEEQRSRLSNLAKTRVGPKASFFGKRHSQETKERIAKAKAGQLPSNSRAVNVNGVVFQSCKAAARHFGISDGLVIYRIRSKKYPQWGYQE